MGVRYIRGCVYRRRLAVCTVKGPDLALGTRSSEVWMMSNRRLLSPPAPRAVTCPECGASVRVIGQRWLAAHSSGSAERNPPAVGRRCPGSLLVIRAR